MSSLLRRAAAPAAACALLAAAFAAAAAAAGPVTVKTVRTSYAPGEPVTVVWTGDGSVDGQVWIEKASAPVRPTKPASNWLSLAGTEGRVRFSGLDLEPGRYEVRVSNMNEYPAVLAARVPFTVRGAAGTKAPAPKSSPASQKAAPAGRAGATKVTTSKSTYRDGEKVVVRWSGVPRGAEIELWIEPRNAPLRPVPTGSMHTGYESGKWAFPSPGPGRTWEIRYFLLGRDKRSHHGPRFTVGPSSVKAPRSGGYGCYFDDYPRGLSRSSLGAIELGAGSTYRALGSSGSYEWVRARAELRMKSGPLRGRVATYRPRGSDGKPVLVFARRANEVGGKPTIDIGDTWCYFGRD